MRHITQLRYLSILLTIAIIFCFNFHRARFALVRISYHAGASAAPPQKGCAGEMRYLLAVRVTAVIVAILATVPLGKADHVQWQSTSSPAAQAVVQVTPTQVLTADVALVAQNRREIRPLFQWRWWGLEIRLNKQQTQIASIAGSGLVVLIPGVGQTVGAAIATIINMIAYSANERGMCAGLNISWLALASPLGSSGVTSVVSKCP